MKNPRSRAFDLVFIAGVPATAKSAYGKWIEEKHGFIHVDVEEHQTSPLKIDVQRRVWIGPDLLVEYLNTLNSDVILNQGFVPNESTLAYVTALKNAGVKLWWFHSDRDTARKAFESRNEALGDDRIDLKYFEIQMDLIDSNWERIKAVFGPNIIETLHSDLSRMAPEDIYEMMFTR
jgi:hypothetical protein